MTSILKTTLLPPANPHVDGSADPVAVPGCQVETLPVETDTVEPHCVKPLALFLYTEYCTVALELSVRPMTDVAPDVKLLKVVGNWYVT